MLTNLGQSTTVLPVVYIDHSNRDGDGGVTCPPTLDVDEHTILIVNLSTVTSRDLVIGVVSDAIANTGSVVVERFFQGGSITAETRHVVAAAANISESFTETNLLECVRISFHNAGAFPCKVYLTAIARP